MLHLLKTALGAIILLAAYHATFGLPIGGRAVGVEEVRASAELGPRGPGGAGAPGARDAASLQLEEVVITPYFEVLTAIGTSRARHSIVVTSEVAGRISESNLVANEMVSAGDVLLRLASDLEEIEVSIAETELENAHQTLQRYRSLNTASSGVVAGITVQEAETAVTLAEAQLAKARHALDALVIEAPVSGRLGLSDLLVGGPIPAGSEIVTIDDTSRIIVSFELPERAIELLEVGRDVQATTPALAGRILEATITAFDSRIDEVTRTVTVQAEFDNVEGRLWPGMSFSVRVPNESAPLPQIPVSALAWTSEGARVWAVHEGAAKGVPVTVRMRQGEVVWVEADLGAGDRIVADGSARLREGAPVAAEDAAVTGQTGLNAGAPSNLPEGNARPRTGASEAAERAPGAPAGSINSGEAG